MRKPYVKPEIAYESFELTTNIAANCSLFSTPQAAFICAVLDPELGETIFSDDNCDFSPPGVNDRICYDVPFENQNVFAS